MRVIRFIRGRVIGIMRAIGIIRGEEGYQGLSRVIKGCQGYSGYSGYQGY